jgi:tRNA-2-methylthio-N6-dimethylallyladenosine synthase
MELETPKSDARAVFIETYGCQMNELDSELVKGQLGALGYQFVSLAEDADIVLINTCSVRELAEHKVWSQLGRLGMLKNDGQPDLVIGVIGCMAERVGEGFFTRAPFVDVVCGPSHLNRLPSLIDNAVRTHKVQIAIAGHTSRRSMAPGLIEDEAHALDRSRMIAPTPQVGQAYVRITRGCDKFCSFFVVPFTRGPENHRPPAAIVDEVRSLCAAGMKEVTLLGQTVNHYHYHDGGRTVGFADLIYLVHESVPELQRLRFVTSYPRDFDDATLDAMAACSRVCKYLHLPAQSGSNRLLKLMNRGYTAEAYLDLLDRARARMPEIRFAGDMIVGFPTETGEDHRASIALVKAAQYKNAFVFKYSPRPGTVADRRLADDVPEEKKRERNLELLEIQDAISLENNRKRIGQEMAVLVESQTKLRHSTPTNGVHLGWKNSPTPTDWVRLIGRTTGDEIVAFDGPQSLLGEIVRVCAVDATSLTLLVELAPLGARPESSLPR